MKLTERDQAVFEAYARGMRYQMVADVLELDKNKIYTATKKLVDLGKIRKVLPGRYEVINGSEPVPLVEKPLLPKLEPVKTVGPQPLPKPVIAPPPKDDIEKIAATLVDRIAELQPLLLLHKELFTVIENVTLALIDRAIEMKSRMLTQDEWDEYQDLKAKKQRALEIVKTKYRKST